MTRATGVGAGNRWIPVAFLDLRRGWLNHDRGGASDRLASDAPLIYIVVGVGWGVWFLDWPRVPLIFLRR